MAECDRMFFPDFMELSDYVIDKMKSRRRVHKSNEVTYG
jgi:hypothetical protein